MILLYPAEATPKKFQPIANHNISVNDMLNIQMTDE